VRREPQCGLDQNVLRQFQPADALQRIAGEIPIADRPRLLHDRHDQQVDAVKAIEDQRGFRVQGDMAEDQQGYGQRDKTESARCLHGQHGRSREALVDEGTTVAT
jgi:hypothetical protein